MMQEELWRTISEASNCRWYFEKQRAGEVTLASLAQHYADGNIVAIISAGKVGQEQKKVTSSFQLIFTTLNKLGFGCLVPEKCTENLLLEKSLFIFARKERAHELFLVLQALVRRCRLKTFFFAMKNGINSIACYNKYGVLQDNFVYTQWDKSLIGKFLARVLEKPVDFDVDRTQVVYYDPLGHNVMGYHMVYLYRQDLMNDGADNFVSKMLAKLRTE